MTGKGRGFFIALLLPSHIVMKEYDTMATNSNVAITDSALELALQKIAAVDVPQGKHIALAYSGGLDSTLCVKLSQLKYHARKLTATTLTPRQGPDAIDQSTARALKLAIP